MNVHAGHTDATAIRALIERCAQAFGDREVEAIMACHTGDVVCFDCHSRNEARGAAAMRGFLEACMPHMHGPVTHDVHDLAVETGGETGGDTAFSHHLVDSSYRDAQGGEHAGWLRVTLGLRRTAEGWKACHAHVPAPFDPMTEKTMLGLPRDASPWENAQ